MPTNREVDYPRLLQFRIALRRFERWSEEQARAAGITPAQHQLLLCIRGHDGESAPTVGQVSEYLLVRPHTAVELVNRAVDAGIVTRRSDDEDARLVRLSLTARGDRILRLLTDAHIQEISRLSDVLRPVVTID